MAFSDLNPTTDLEAVNAMLVSIGEAPLSALGSGEQLEDIAVDIFEEALRQLCSRRWRFNSEYQYALSSGGDDSNGWPVFEVPTGMASWRLSLTEVNRGIDVVAREERDYAANDGARIFADRLNGTDGIQAIDGNSPEELLIDPVWIVDFDDLPQSARTALTIGAARRFQQQVLGSEADAPFGFSEEDERQAVGFLLEDQQETVPVPPLSTSPATELESLNQILQMADERPAIALTAIRDEAQYQGLQILRDAMREIQAEGWEFNTEESYELAPDDTYAWTGSGGTSVTLNVWEFPSNILDWQVTPSSDQLEIVGDLTVRQPVEYSGTNAIFYDRKLNRDGLDQDDHEYLYLDITWLIPFDDLPEKARQYITMIAARRFLQTRPDIPANRLPWTERDVRMAEKALQKSQGQERRRNLFDHGDMRDALGRRHPNRYRLTRDTNRR